MPIFECRDLSKSYGDVPALSHVFLLSQFLFCQRALCFFYKRARR